MAAIYLDSRDKHGLSEIERVIRKLFLPHLPENAEGYITRDYKSELQEHVQKLTGCHPHTNLLMKQVRIIKKNSPWLFCKE